MSVTMVAALLGSESTDTMSMTLLGYSVWMTLSTDPDPRIPVEGDCLRPLRHMFRTGEHGRLFVATVCWLVVLAGVYPGLQRLVACGLLAWDCEWCLVLGL